MPRRRAIVIASAMVAAAMPFLLIQAIFDLGVTGSVLHTPYSAYLSQDQPGSEFGFRHVDPHARPASPLVEKHEFFQWTQPYIEDHQPGNFLGRWVPRYLSLIIDTLMQCRLLLVFLPIGLLGFADSKFRVPLATLPVFLILYACNPIFLEHYAMAIIPAAVLAILLGGKFAGTVWPPIESGFVLAILAISLTSFWEINRHVAPPDKQVSDETFSSSMLVFANDWSDMDQVQKPAVVLFTYHPGSNFKIEPVYNTACAWPMDAPIIRAHDLGPRNTEIFRWFAEHQPTRMFYSFDPATGALMPLGHPAQLLASADPKVHALRH